MSSEKHSILDCVLKDILNWIEKNLTSKIEVKDISKVSGYGIWHLQRMFRQRVGVPIMTYIRMRRLTMAAIELRFTRSTIIDIAIKYKWESQSGFTRSFATQFNITPSRWRKLNKVNYNGLVVEAKI